MITTVRPSRRALFRGAPPVNADDGRPIPTSAKETIGSPAAELGYRPALDGLRAVAVIAVLFFHARFSWAKGGFLGVSTFFTLSGFLITTLLISEHHRSGGISLRSFWTRRFRRLLPAAWMTLAGVVGASAFGVWNDDQMRALRGDVPSAFLQLINWHFVAGGRSYGDQFAAPSPLEHFWSLAIEEQFYVVFPLVALLALRWAKGRRWPLAAAMGVMAVMSAIVSGLTAGGSTGRAYFGTDTRLMELCIGVILATVLSGRFTAVTQRARSWLVLPGLFAVVVTGWSWTHFTVESRSLYPWGLLMTAACSAALITAALQPGLISSALSVAPMRWIGRLSYGIYLIHWPVFLWLTPTRTDLGAWPLFVLRMAVTLVLAMASNRLVEDPIRRRRRLTGPIRGAVVPGFIGAVLIVLVLTTADLPAVRELDRASATGPIAAAAPPPTRVLIVGDRLAASLGAGLANVDASTFVVKVGADPDCGVVTGGFVQLPDGTVEFDSARCRSVRAHQQATEAAFRPDVVLVWSGMRDVANRRLSNNEPWGQPGVADVDDLLRTEVAATVDGLSKGGATVMWMTMPLVSDTENPPPPPPPAAGEPGHGQYQELQLEGARKDAPAAAFVQNDPARHAVELAGHQGGRQARRACSAGRIAAQRLVGRLRGRRSGHDGPISRGRGDPTRGARPPGLDGSDHPTRRAGLGGGRCYRPGLLRRRSAVPRRASGESATFGARRWPGPHADGRRFGRCELRLRAARLAGGDQVPGGGIQLGTAGLCPRPRWELSVPQRGEQVG